MRRILFGVVFAMAFAVALTGVVNAAPVPQLNVGDEIGFSDKEGTVGGGEFAVHLYSGGAFGPELFRTFCIQSNANIGYIPTSRFVISGITKKIELGSFDLSPKVAYLFTKFFNGTLSGYDYTPGSAAHIDDANAFQLVLWYLQSDYGGTIKPYLLHPNYASIKPQMDAWIADANAAGWTDVGAVRVLNLNWVAPAQNVGKDAQDVLTLVPLPASVWAGLGLLACLGAARVRSAWRRD